MIRIPLGATVVAAVLFALSTPAFAHVTLENGTAAIGASYKAVLRVPHGCAGDATLAVHVQIPEGFFNVKPMPKAGWTLETVTGPYAQGYDNHGATLTEGVKEIAWTGGNLPDAWYDEFVFRGTFAETLEPGRFFFPTVQQCANGEEAWIEVSGDDDAAMPAPSLELVPAGPAAH